MDNWILNNWILLITVPIGILNLICFGALFRAGFKQQGFYRFASSWLLFMIVVGIGIRMS